MPTDLVEAIKGTLVATLAKVFKPVAHADNVITCPPEWVRASTAEALTGLKREKLNELVKFKQVVAKRADKVVLYKYADILKAIDTLPDFKKGNY